MLPVHRARCAARGAPSRIDTYKAEVAEAALAAGAEIVNDVSGGALDPEHPARWCARARRGAGRSGTCAARPRTMQAHAHYRRRRARGGRDGARRARSRAARAAGVPSRLHRSIPGSASPRRAEHNLQLLARLGELRAARAARSWSAPSRKAFLGQLTGAARRRARELATAGGRTRRDPRAARTSCACTTSRRSATRCASPTRSGAPARASMAARRDRRRCRRSMRQASRWREALTAGVDILIVYYVVYRALLSSRARARRRC